MPRIPVRGAALSASILLPLSVALVSPAEAQAPSQVPPMGGAHGSRIPESTTPFIHYQFPFQTMWDDAVIRGRETGKPALAFDLDLIDSNSIRLAREIIDDTSFQAFARAHFEPAMNDFAVDPPVSVGLDSLRNLGQRLSGLEKKYLVPLRPTILVISPAGDEIDRIVTPQDLTLAQIRSRLTDILEGRNTIHSLIVTFWRDTTSIVMRQNLIDQFERRSRYDSVLKHLEVLAHLSSYPSVARAALIRYSYLRLQVEGNPEPIELYMSLLSRHGADSVQYLQALQALLDQYQKMKRTDSVSAYFDRIMAFTGVRDPDLLNDYAWHLANYTKDREKALALVNEAIAKNAKDPNYYDTRALVEALLVKLDAAIADEQKAIAMADTPEDRSDFQEKLEYYNKRKTEAEEILRKEKEEQSAVSSVRAPNAPKEPSVKKQAKSKR